MNVPVGRDPDFERLLSSFDRDELLSSDETIFGLWPDLTLAFVNDGWRQFAAQNNAADVIREQWSEGCCVSDAMAAPLHSFFSSNYARCLAEGRPWEHCYECSSAQLYRKFHMVTYPLGNAEGLLVVNSLRQETAHTRTACSAIEELYRNEHGIVTQCCHCRRVRRCGTDSTWDWVPDWVTASPSGTSHGLCPPCVGFHYSPQFNANTESIQPFRTGMK